MRKSRFLALFLTIVFVLANVTIPSFAENSTPKTPGDFLTTNMVLVGSIPNHPFHISYKTEGATAYAIATTSTPEIAKEQYVVSDGVWEIPYLSPWADYLKEGASPLTRNYTTTYASMNVTGGTAYASTQKITALLPGYVFDFNDGTTMPENSDLYCSTSNGRYVLQSTTAGKMSIANDTDGRYYAVAGSGENFVMYPNYTFMRVGYTSKAGNVTKGLSAPFVFEMEIKDLSSAIPFPTDKNLIGIASGKIDETWANTASAGATKGANYDEILANFKSEGWHKYKWVITPFTYTSANGVSYSPMFDLYIDDQLFLKNVSVSTFNAATSDTAPFTANGVDNFKFYGTSLGFAHDVTLTASNGNAIGSVLEASASYAQMPTGTISESLEVGIYKLNSETGEYDKVSEDGETTYTLKEIDMGSTFKAGAFVKEAAYDECESAVAYSAEYIEAGAAPSEPEVEYSWGTKPSISEANIIWAPYGDETYDIPFTYSVENATSDAQFTITDMFGNEVEGVEVVHDPTTTASNSKKAILRIGDIENPTHYYSDASTFVGGTDTFELTISGAGLEDTINVRQYKKNDFENSNTNSFSVKVDTDDDGKTDTWIPAGEIQTEGDNKYLYNAGEYMFDLSSTGCQFKGVLAVDFDAKIDEKFKLKSSQTPGLIVVQSLANKPGYVYSMYHGSNHPVYVGEGWKPVRIIYDFSNSKYSCFINGTPVVVNSDIYWQLQTVEKENTKGIDYLYYTGSMDNLGFSNVTVTTPVVYNATIMNAAVGKPITLDYDFYCGNNYDSSNTTVEYKIADAPNATTWTTFDGTLTSDHLGKYVKAVITPAISYNGATITGTAVTTNPVRVGDVYVNSIAIDNSFPISGTTYTPHFDAVNGAFDERVITKHTSSTYDLTVTVNAGTTNGADEKVTFVFAHYTALNDKLYLRGLSSQEVTLTSAAQNVTLEYTTPKVGQSELFKLFMLTSDGLVPVNSVINLR